MSLNYIQYVTAISSLIGTDEADARLASVIPNVIDDAEQRLYRDLDVLDTVIRDATATLTANSRNFVLPQTVGRFVVTESINVFTPFGTIANRNQLIPVSREFLDATWANEASTTTPSVPTYYAMITSQAIIVGPPPDAAYVMEVVGTIRPNPLSAANTTTLLSLYLPDLFIAASMMFIKQIGIPIAVQQAQPWETHYQTLLASANVEEMRKRYASQGWTPKQPDAVATPPRM